ncbi:hypothetical protein PIB30_028542 [Stylosanthes scabra]|uniref:Transmembrane protein n=1 Tax=Stylosanthes scabra TaxID=79078 RepID=A0ABU6SAL4_9FABA|nr:hypothetical protein [Stylosanthes scabra]
MVVMSRLLPDHVVQRLATGPGRVGPITDLMSSLAIRMNHCKFFLWLDQHSAKFGRVAETKSIKEDEVDVDEHFWRLNVENRVSELERRIASIEKKDSMKFLVVCVLALSMVIALYFGNHK